ncbi:MAG TPA: invasion associated locus B family protein [Rhodobacteraceae bacterium]|nr:invasion associated locus B family protein [Paracoccaceae bacterium]
MEKIGLLMKHKLIPAIIAFLVVSPVTFAQETATVEETETSNSTEFKTAEELVQASKPAIGEGYLREKYGEWELRCIKAEVMKEEECRVFNFLVDQDGNTIAQLDMQVLSAGGKAVAGVDIATPLGSLLTAQVVLKIDAGKAKRYPYTWCDQQGCYARFGMTQEEIDAMKRGAKANVTILSVAAPDQPLSMDLSLSGFTAVWNAIAPQ